MSEKTIVPVVFATDDGYAPYLGVALHSLINHTNPNNEYHIYIFFREMSREHRKRLECLSSRNVAIKLCDIKYKVDELSDYKTNEHYTVEATYRFFIAEILSQYSKVIYLDCDIIILDDIAKLFNFDIQDNILGVAEMAIDEIWVENLVNRLNVKIRDGFNSGVLIINTNQFLKQHIKEKCLNLLQEDWKLETPRYICPDQDALTIMCKDKIAKFPMNWNFRWNMEMPEKGRVPILIPEIQPIYDEAKKDIKIIHFASEWKPWNAPECKYSDIFWKYARETIFYEEILIRETRPKKEKIRHKFPWKSIEAGSTIVIYGGGDVGRNYLNQINMTSYCCISAICDQNAKKLNNFILPVVTKDELLSIKFDYIVIAIDSEDIAEIVRDDLINLGIDTDKIKWK